MKASSASRHHSRWLLAALFVAFMAFIIHRSLHVAGYRCAVCITFRGQSVCRTVEGPTQHEALSGAKSNVCADLASGVTDSLACERTEPSKVDCGALD